MKKILTYSLLFLFSSLAFGMESKEQREARVMCEIARIKCMMYTNPQQAIIESAALASGKSIAEIKDLQEFDISEVKDINRNEAGNFINYYATLHSGDCICADYFVAGPMQGQYTCSRDMLNDTGRTATVKLPDAVYHDLKKLYEESAKK